MNLKSHLVLHSELPDGQAEQAAARLPSMRPIEGAWLRCDEVYDAQMAERRRLISTCFNDVYAQMPCGVAAARAFLEDVLIALPTNFKVGQDEVMCPDGVVTPLDWNAPLLSVGAILQQDVCILEKRDDAHVLTGAILCFPASWTLAEKIGKPLVGIHAPVAEYDNTIAKRVQRLFDGVQRGRPLWRANHLRYDDPTLYQPRMENDPQPVGSEAAGYIRSERQTVLRLSAPDAVAFVIHTFVIDAD